MAVDDYSGNELHHLRRDSREAHSNSQLAKWLSIIALAAAAIAMALAMQAMNKATDALNNANRSLNVQTTR
jgi:hypothetical protein